MVSSGWRRVLGRLVDVAVRSATAPPARRQRRPAGRPSPDQPLRSPLPQAGPPRLRKPATEHVGPVHVEYRPVADGDPDPGEVVWAWVPFEEVAAAVNRQRGRR